MRSGAGLWPSGGGIACRLSEAVMENRKREGRALPYLFGSHFTKNSLMLS